MLKAIADSRKVIAGGLLAASLVGGAAYWLEQRVIAGHLAVETTQQLREIEERLRLASSELDATAAFLSETGLSVSSFDGFLRKLRLTRIGEVPWAWAQVIPVTSIPDLEAAVRQQTREPGFTVHGHQLSGQWAAPVVTVHGPIDARIKGADLLASPAVADRAGPGLSSELATTFDFAVTGLADGFPVAAFYLGRLQAPARGNAVSGLKANLILRGVTEAVVRRSAGLGSGQVFRIADVTAGGTPRLLLGREISASNGPSRESRISLDRLELLLTITEPPPPRAPALWILVTLAGLLATGLAVFLRAGLLLGNRAASLSTALETTESQLSDTRRKETAFFENSGTANCETDAASGRLLRVNEGMCRLLGYNREELIGKRFTDFTHAADLDRNLSAMFAADGSRLPVVHLEKRYIRKDGTPVWCLITGRLISDALGQPLSYATVIIDISDRKRDEDIKSALVRELAHRVRNTVQLTSSLARQTARNARSVADYDTKFNQRLAALKAAQDLLFDADWKAASLRDIARSTLKPFRWGRGTGEWISISLPDIELPAQHAQTLAIALHELAGNSAHTGAISNGGSVELTGELQTGADGVKRLHLRWQETSLKPIRKPRKTGFGTIMLLNALPQQFDGTASMSWPRSGMIYDAVLILPQSD